MNENKYLNEERYLKNKKKIISVAYIVLALGLLAGGSLISFGIISQAKINNEYSDENKETLNLRITEEREKLEAKKQELMDNGAKYSEFAKYTDGDDYTVKVITKAMDPSFNYCGFPEYKDNDVTKEYCSLKKQLSEMNDDFNKRFDSFKSIPFYMFGGFLMVASFMAFTAIYSFAKRREILAFQAEQVMPVAKEGMKEVAPDVGNLAKEISKGIKDGFR